MPNFSYKARIVSKVIFFFSFIFLTACQNSSDSEELVHKMFTSCRDDEFESLELRMTTADVLSLMGEPDSKDIQANDEGGDVKIASQLWTYLSSETADGVIKIGFDETGKVLSFTCTS